jgi:hypothetical protein
VTRVALLLPLLLALALAACGGDDAREAGPPLETVTVGGADPPATERQVCSNDDAGYAVSYPPDWHEAGCRWFDPDPIEVPEATEFLDVAVSVSREPVPLEALEDDLGTDVSDRLELELDGRRALRLEGTSTGEGLLDAGVRVTRIGIEAAPGETIVLATQDVEGVDYERAVGALDDIAASLRLASG